MAEIEQKLERNLILTLMVRILLPCLPIFIERIIAFLVPEYDHQFPNRDVLVVAFLIPIVWIIEMKNKIMLLTAIIFVMLAVIPYILSLICPTPRVFMSGLILAIAAIVIFASIEIALSSKNRFPNSIDQRFDI
jgi:hypothetical protein